MLSHDLEGMRRVFARAEIGDALTISASMVAAIVARFDDAIEKARALEAAPVAARLRLQPGGAGGFPKVVTLGPPGRPLLRIVPRPASESRPAETPPRPDPEVPPCA